MGQWLVSKNMRNPKMSVPGRQVETKKQPQTLMTSVVRMQWRLTGRPLGRIQAREEFQQLLGRDGRNGILELTHLILLESEKVLHIST